MPSEALEIARRRLNSQLFTIRGLFRNQQVAGSIPDAPILSANMGGNVTLHFHSIKGLYMGEWEQVAETPWICIRGRGLSNVEWAM